MDIVLVSFFVVFEQVSRKEVWKSFGTCWSVYRTLILHVIILGVLQADPGVIREKEQIFRLFCHEAQRVFHDRLINNEDKTYFNEMLGEMAQKHFQTVRHVPVATVVLLRFFSLSVDYSPVLRIILVVVHWF